MRLTPLDVLLGHQKVIECTWFFPGSIDALSLRRSLRLLTRIYPMVGGRLVRQPYWSKQHLSPLHGWQVRRSTVDDAGILLHINSATARSSQEAASLVDPSSLYCDQSCNPRRVMVGDSPVMAAALTNFADGGSAVGLRISHAVVDANGFYQLANEWSRLHQQLDLLSGGDGGEAEDGAEPPLLKLQRDVVEAPLLDRTQTSSPLSDEHRDRALSAIDMTSWRGAALFWALQTLDRPSPAASWPRAHVALSAADVDELRARCAVGSTARRPAKAEACIASLARVASRALHLPDSTEVVLQMPFDVRRAARLPASYAGNAFHVIEGRPMPRAPHAMDVASLCANIRELTTRSLFGNSMDDPSTLSGGWLWNARMLGRGWMPARSPAPDETSGQPVGAAPSATPVHRLVANFQAHLPAFDVTFGAGECMRAVPGVGDTLQIVAGPRNGVDLYLNLGAPLAGQPPQDWSQLREQLLNP
jgi:hypothetical protein